MGREFKDCTDHDTRVCHVVDCSCDCFCLCEVKDEQRDDTPSHD